MVFQCPKCAAENLDSSLPDRAEQAREAREFDKELRQLAPQRPVVTYTLIGLCTAAFLLELAKGAGFGSMSVDLAIRLGADFGPLTLGGQWWRLLTSMFLHFGFFHILLNMWCLADLGTMAERLMGRAAFALLYLVTGLAGGLATLAINSQVVSAGASGAVFGVAGGLITYLWLKKAPLDLEKAKKRVRSLGVFLLYNLYYSLRPGVSLTAHAGGLFAGLALGVVLPRFLPLVEATAPVPSPTDEPESRNRRLTAVAVVCAVLLLGGALEVKRLQWPVVQLNQAAQLIDSGKPAEAIPILERILRERPSLTQARLLLGMAFLNNGQPEKAIKPLKLAIAEGLHSPEAEFDLGLAYLRSGHYVLAVDHLQSAVKEAPEDPKSHYALGIAYRQQRVNAQAVAELQRAIQLKPDWLEAQDELALAYMQSGKPGTAQAILDQVLAKHPDDPQAKALAETLARQVPASAVAHQPR